LTVPLDVVLCFHNAFRRATQEMDDTAFKVARSGGDIASVLKRYQFAGEFLGYHAKGEEEAVFPVVEKLVPQVVKTYLLDHRELDTMVDGLDTMQAEPDALKAARTTAVLNSHLRIHLYKEDTYLYPILKEQLTVSEQSSIIGVMSRDIPQDKTPKAIRWLFPLLTHNDRALVAKTWMTMMPPQVFAGIKPLIRETIADDWDELIQRVPELK